jgi:hypothetical protein
VLTKRLNRECGDALNRSEIALADGALVERGPGAPDVHSDVVGARVAGDAQQLGGLGRVHAATGAVRGDPPEALGVRRTRRVGHQHPHQRVAVGQVELAAVPVVEEGVPATTSQLVVAAAKVREVTPLPGRVTRPFRPMAARPPTVR